MVSLMRRLMVLGCVLVLLFVLAGVMRPHQTSAQVRISPTPLQFVIPTQAPLPTSVVIATPTPTWTPTIVPPPMIRARQSDNPINVRAEPDPGGERLGSLDPNGQFEVFGRYFRWLQFAYEGAPTGRAWVYDELVEIIGDEADIPIVDPFSSPTPSRAQDSPQNDETATAEARIVALPTDNVVLPGGNSAQRNPQGLLPTFTPPPELATRVSTPTPAVFAPPTATPDILTVALENVAAGRIPPIVPIVGLGLLGLLGLGIALIRGI